MTVQYSPGWGDVFDSMSLIGIAVGTVVFAVHRAVGANDTLSDEERRNGASPNAPGNLERPAFGQEEVEVNCKIALLIPFILSGLLRIVPGLSPPHGYNSIPALLLLLLLCSIVPRDARHVCLRCFRFVQLNSLHAAIVFANVLRFPEARIVARLRQCCHRDRAGMGGCIMHARHLDRNWQYSMWKRGRVRTVGFLCGLLQVAER